MAGSVQDQSARDDAHLRSLGIKPELRRSLGFLSNFAVAFSYISVSTGTFTLIALGLGVGGPAFFWSWPLVILGQTFVALNFAELASHFPVAGLDLPVVEAALEPDARLVHRLVLFLGRRRDGDRGRRARCRSSCRASSASS